MSSSARSVTVVPRRRFLWQGVGGLLGLGLVDALMASARAQAGDGSLVPGGYTEGEKVITTRASMVDVGVKKLPGFEPGWQLSVDPWQAVVHQNPETGPRDMLVWRCEWPMAIRFDTPGHFYDPNPFSLGTRVIGELKDSELQKRFGVLASSGPVKTAVPVRLGPFKYSIDIFAEANVVLTIDPDYLIEKQG